MQQARLIGQVLFSYATDNTANGNAYPDGKSSTEICQMMLDQGYATDPALFYVPMPGKVKMAAGQTKLKPENVCWDITGGVTSDDSDFLPVVFLTGYRVNYAPGGAAVPVIKPYPVYYSAHPSFWFGPGAGISPGIAVFFKGNNAMWVKDSSSLPPHYNSNSLEHFISTDFNPHGKTYRQLTPDGVLSPE